MKHGGLLKIVHFFFFCFHTKLIFIGCIQVKIKSSIACVKVEGSLVLHVSNVHVPVLCTGSHFVHFLYVRLQVPFLW